MIQNIHYLVGPNGTGKTRALNRICDLNDGFYIPKQRPTPSVGQFDEGSTRAYIDQFKQHNKTSPEQIAMALLRENAILRYTVFSILSRKLGRNFSVEIVERSQHFKITSGLNNEYFKDVIIPRYDLVGESSGLRELLILLTLIHSGLSTKYFIDEPELSLHPEAQRFLKNEMIRLATEKNCQFWIATHSPIFFSPESIDELKQATFFSDPQKTDGAKPDFDSLSEGEKIHLEKSLLRLDSEKWLLVHSKAVIFCEGFRDKVIFKTVLDKASIDLSRHDFCIVETGGKGDFSTLFLLCKAIDKPSYFIGDLDCLIDCKLLDKFDTSEIMINELKGIAPTILDYISRNIREPLGRIQEELIKINDTDFQAIDVESKIFPHLTRIKKKSDNSKSLSLELINKHPELIKKLITTTLHPLIDLLSASTNKAIEMLKKVGFFIIQSGSLETFYAASPASPDDDKEKMKLFDIEFENIKKESVALTENRYESIIQFSKFIIKDTFDNKKFIRDEIIKVLSKIQTILLEERPSDLLQLKDNPKYISLKVTDLLDFSSIIWTGEHFNLNGKTTPNFEPAFDFNLSSNKGIISEETIKFR